MCINETQVNQHHNHRNAHTDNIDSEDLKRNNNMGDNDVQIRNVNKKVTSRINLNIQNNEINSLEENRQNRTYSRVHTVLVSALMRSGSL